MNKFKTFDEILKYVREEDISSVRNSKMWSYYGLIKQFYTSAFQFSDKSEILIFYCIEDPETKGQETINLKIENVWIDIKTGNVIREPSWWNEYTETLQPPNIENLMNDLSNDLKVEVKLTEKCEHGHKHPNLTCQKCNPYGLLR